MDVLQSLIHNHELATKSFQINIIPMVLIPLTAVTVALTSIAGIIAGWFGIKLHTEGPKQFLEVLLKKRVLFSMIFINLLGFGGYKAYIYIKNRPSFIFTIKQHSKENARPSSEVYTESLSRPHDFIGKILDPQFHNLTLEKEVKFKKGAFRSAVVTNNSLFYGMDDGNIYEIDKKNLLVKRKFFIGTQVTTRPLIYKDRLYAGEGNHYTHHARVYSFNLKTGEYINSFQTKGHTEGQPLIASHKGLDLLFIPAGLDGLFAVDPISMKEVWHKKDGHLDATVTIDQGIVYIGTGFEKGFERDRSFAVAYEFASGKIIWKKELPLSNWMHPIVGLQDVCYVLGEIYFPSDVGLFYCLNKKSGIPHFSIPFNAPIASKPFYLKDTSHLSSSGEENEYVFIGDLNGEICGIHLNQKEKIWCHQTGTAKTTYALSSFQYDPVHHILWYPSMNNGLYALGPIKGEILNQWEPSPVNAKWKSTFASVSLDDNYLYTIDLAGNLRKFNIK